MKIIKAQHAGFCFGVKRAVDAIESALKLNKFPVWTIGLPIHNPQEVKRLQDLGLHVAKDESEIPAGAQVLIRAHGEPLETLKKLTERGVIIQDMTCPFVKKAQDLAAEFSGRGYHVILLGDKNHPEIIGIAGHVMDGSVEIIADENEAENIFSRNKIALISQTTQREEKLSRAAGALVKKASQLHVCNTICKATAQRQDAVRELVRKNKLDGVILIGGKESANTGKLRDILQSEGVNVLWVEDEKELKQNFSWLDGKNQIGIAAGASTPEWLIINIVNIIAAN